jgi:cyclopropane fatty-acyl-phospholipid synthase-like methyltransferase
MLRFIASQLGNPRGWFGRHVMARLLNRGNRELIEATVLELGIERDHRVLDVGFGGGYGMRLSLGRAKDGTVVGIDPSADMVDRARRKFARAVADGRLELRCEGVEALPHPATAYDRILSTNTVYFWPSLHAPFEGLAAALQPGGMLALGFSSAAKMRSFEPISRHGFNVHEDEAIAEAARAAGLTDVELLRQHGRRTRGDIILRATKSNG